MAAANLCRRVSAKTSLATTNKTQRAWHYEIYTSPSGAASPKSGIGRGDLDFPTRLLLCHPLSTRYSFTFGLTPVEALLGTHACYCRAFFCLLYSPSSIVLLLQLFHTKNVECIAILGKRKHIVYMNKTKELAVAVVHQSHGGRAGQGLWQGKQGPGERHSCTNPTKPHHLRRSAPLHPSHQSAASPLCSRMLLYHSWRIQHLSQQPTKMQVEAADHAEGWISSNTEPAMPVDREGAELTATPRSLEHLDLAIGFVSCLLGVQTYRLSVDFPFETAVFKHSLFEFMLVYACHTTKRLPKVQVLEEVEDPGLGP